MTTNLEFIEHVKTQQEIELTQKGVCRIFDYYKKTYGDGNPIDICNESWDEGLGVVDEIKLEKDDFIDKD